MQTQGVGTSPEEFEQGLLEGSIVGHVGFPESLQLIADALGWKLEAVSEERTPIIAGEPREGAHIEVSPGQVAGCHHVARAVVQGREAIVLEHPQQVEPSAAGVETGDFIQIKGTPNISTAITPEIPGGVGTIALAANMVGPVVAARPGLKTMIDMPVPRGFQGDVRTLIEQLQRQLGESKFLEGEK
jgi:4-hydroxy-tetrahydrodipicolinate reductase